jgi:arsenate reductase
MKLLFICTHNRCRSILAEAITNHFSKQRIVAASAGSSPQGGVHPLSLKFLKQRNIDTKGLKSQSWDEFQTFEPDAILTLCDNAANEACPVWFDNAVQVHWGFEDPSSAALDQDQQRIRFGETIDLMARRIQRLLEENTSALSGPQLQEKLQSIGQQVQH